MKKRRKSNERKRGGRVMEVFDLLIKKVIEELKGRLV